MITERIGRRIPLYFACPDSGRVYAPASGNFHKRSPVRAQ